MSVDQYRDPILHDERFDKFRDSALDRGAMARALRAQTNAENMIEDLVITWSLQASKLGLDASKPISADTDARMRAAAARLICDLSA